MKILFTGLPYFGKKLVDELTKFDQENSYVFCDTYYSKKDKLKFLFHLPSANLVVSFNGVTSKSRALDWSLKFKKKILMFWHGSDVLTAKKNKVQKSFVTDYISKSISFSDAPWLIDELNELGIKAELLPFKFVDAVTNKSNFETKGVFTYIAQDNEVFYGFDSILRLAEKNPTLIFHIAGTNGKNLTNLQNLKFYGWLTEEAFVDMLDKHAIFVRFTNHDGYSLSVMRAIANGNHVIWNHPHVCTNLAVTDDELFQKLNQLLTKNEVLNRNLNAMNWAAENLNREKVLSNFVSTLKNYCDAE